MDPALYRQQGALAQPTFEENLRKKFAGFDPMKSQILKGLYDAITAPYRAYQGNPMVDGVPMYDPETYQRQQMEDAMNVAGTAMTGGFALGRAPVGSLGMNVYHGSPHKFDKFDMSKIGTGEGAQAYGHGLYFAENPQVAKNYAPRDFAYEDRLMAKYKQAEARRDYDAMEVLESAMLHQTPSELRTQYPKAGKLIDDIAAEQSKAKFNLYKVDLPDEHIAKMLDWDKPVSPELRQRVIDALPSHQRDLSGSTLDASGTAAYRSLVRGESVLDGAQLYNLLEQNMGKQQASEVLKAAGIPGIKYLDQGSRTGGKGTSNFVVFDDQIPKIIGRE